MLPVDTLIDEGSETGIARQGVLAFLEKRAGGAAAEW